MDSQTLAYYNDNAEVVSLRYEAAAGGVASVFPFVFVRGESVLEIGAGSGRDAGILLELGVEVDAVEPSPALRARALAAHPELDGRLFDGFLPAGLPPGIKEKYDGILLSGVLMHIPDAELFDAAFTLRGRLNSGGKLLVSIPIERNDVQPGAERDASGRLMIIRSDSQVRLLFERLGFTLENEWKSADSAGRTFLWATLLFRLSGASSRAIDRVESIINADRKVATYKLALVRALCDIVTTSWASARWEPGGAVRIPLRQVSEKWLRYYWPLLETEAGAMLPQINAEAKGGKQIAFRKKVTELIQECRPLGGITAFERMGLEGRLPPVAESLHRGALRIISSTIVKGPVQFAGNARGIPEFAYDRDSASIVVPADVWRELSLMGHWIRDAVILRWAEMTARLSEGKLLPGAVIDRLLAGAEPFRQDPVVRSFYDGHRADLACVWTGRSLGTDFEVDHAIPFAFWQASPAWNLFPAARSVNNAKRDKLPATELVHRREEAIVGYWRMLAAEFPARFAREAGALLGSYPGKNWEKPLMSGFTEAVEYTAAVRGAERWQPR
jgi:SAM-dependent methyltransferase